MVSPPLKLKMFTGSVCVLLTSVSLNLINKNKINLRNHEFVRKKQNGGWKVSDADWFYFPLYDPSWSEYNFILFSFFYSIRVDPSWSDPDWRSELIRSDFCTCLTQKHICSWWTLKMSWTYDLLILILKQTKGKKASTKDCSIKSREWHLRRTCCWLQCKSKTHDSQHVYSFRNLSSF